ncbi:MAG: hypothetical protein AAGG75_08410, partial [Bacteroidota bacterium]
NMQKIVFVAFDPSSNTKDQLIESAIKLVQARNYRLFLFGVVGRPALQPVYQRPYSVVMAPEENMEEEELEATMKALVHRYRGQYEDIQMDYGYGFEGKETLNKIDQLAAKLRPVYTVLEQTNEPSWLTNWLGNAETIVTQDPPYPTVVLPSGYKLKHIKHITYALDLSINHTEHINRLRNLAFDFDAHLEIVLFAKYQQEKELGKAIQAYYQTAPNIRVVNLKNVDTFADLMQRVEHIEQTIFAFPNRREGFFKQAFSSDHAGRLFLSSDVPVVVF